MAACASCGAAIVWAWTEREKRMPVDLLPSPTGTIKFEDRVVDGHARRYVKLVGKSETEVRYVSHYATCPDASNWRRRK